MRCLWITRQDPRPADSGELIYTLGLLTSLAVQPGFEITVLAHEPAKPCDGGPPLTWQLHGSIPAGRLKSLASSLPADAFRLGNPIQRAALGRLLERAWDWIVIDQAACAWALPMIPKEAKVAYIAHNHETEVRRQVAAEHVQHHIGEHQDDHHRADGDHRPVDQRTERRQQRRRRRRRPSGRC